MYIPIVLPEGLATPLDVLGYTPSVHDSMSGSSAHLARRVISLRGNTRYGIGGGIALAFICVFVLGVLARCVIRERRARQQARAHVQALAIQDREFWGVGTNSGRRIERQREEEDEEEREETEAERRIRRRQERREREHGRFDSILERMEKRALQEEGLKESGRKMPDGGTTEQISEKELSEGSKGSGSDSEGSGSEKVAKPEPVYKGAGTRLSGGRISLSNLRSSIS